MSRFTRISERLHRGDLSIDFVGRRKLWYTISVLIMAAAAVGIFGKGLHMGIEFEGGAQYTVNEKSISADEARDAIAAATGGEQSLVQEAGDRVRIQVSGTSSERSKEIMGNLATELGVPDSKIDAQVIGPSWGTEISKKAWTGLAIFMVLVTVYLAIAFEWRMAAAALIALVHDLVITIGFYALVGFEVTPGTVIGLLTILGYSLYDTVVVFDTVRENTRGLTKQTKWTYSDAANRGLNQTLVRSVNTTVVALLPVAALLFVGGGLLGAGMLNDIALALFIGLAAGAYSSICVATPFLAAMKERQPSMRELAGRVAARREQERLAAEAPVEAAATGEAAAVAAGGRGGDDRGDDVVVRRQPVGRNRGRGRPSGKKR